MRGVIPKINDFEKVAKALFEEVVGSDGEGYINALSILMNLGYTKEQIELTFNGEETE